MAVSRTIAEDLARTLHDIYARAADQLTVQVGQRLEADLAGVNRPDRLERRLLAAEALREQSRRLVERLDTEMADAVEQMVVLAAERGSVEAFRELGRLGFQLPSTIADVRRSLPGAEAVQRLAYSLTSTLRGTHLRITRWPTDVYREITSRESADILLGTRTRRQAAQQMWQQFVSRGITGFVDRSGRAWRLESYVDMASRTIAAQAAVEAHLDRLAEAGVDLVIVSDAPQECKLCRPWESKVLSRSGGGARTIEVEHATQDGVMVEVRITGSIDDAVAAGLMHPNCRHSLSAFLPGITRLPAPSPEEPAGPQREAPERRELPDQADAAASTTEAPTPEPPTPRPPPRQLSPTEALAMQDRMLADIPWTEAQHGALREYTSSAYHVFNSWLRSPEYRERFKGDPDISVDRLTNDLIPNAVAGMRPLPESVVVARRTDPAQFGLDIFPGREDLNLDMLLELRGQVHQDPGFMSTTVDSLADATPSKPGKITLQINVPAGYPAAYVDGISRYPGENELVLPPGTKLRILDVVENDHRGFHVITEVVP